MGVSGGVPFRTGDVVQVAEQHYCYGLGCLTFRILEVGRRERHSDGLWIHLRGVDLGDPSGPRQRRILARLDAVQPTPPGPVAHIAARPGWECLGCGQDWPCPDRRRRLLQRYDRERMTLSIYLGAQLADASADLPDVPPGVLYRRFLGWLPDRHEGPGTL
ncbi:MULTISPECIES: hypothetical protein [unclassified Micromonospora]|uniref:hypothetical protein n=1 Tax=Verrucosispora sp. TAA-831 TaxID=3422227 RepID=UPI003D6EC01D